MELFFARVAVNALGHPDHRNIIDPQFGQHADNKSKTEIVLLITPRVVRNIVAPAFTRDDLADLATDDLTDIEDMDADRAAKLIMAARAHWFE